MVIAALADLVVSSTEVAVSVTADVEGTFAGGVYVVEFPLAVPEGTTLPQVGEQGVPP